LEGLLQQRHDDLSGIINGVDYSQWNPETDRKLNGHNYGVKNFAEGKAACSSTKLAKSFFVANSCQRATLSIS